MVIIKFIELISQSGTLTDKEGGEKIIFDFIVFTDENLKISQPSFSQVKTERKYTIAVNDGLALI